MILKQSKISVLNKQNENKKFKIKTKNYFLILPFKQKPNRLKIVWYCVFYINFSFTITNFK